MDYSVARQLTSKIPNRASTEEIKQGLQRIKKAQQQVLQQLKKNHPDYSIDVRTTNSQMYRIRQAQAQNLKRELNVERQKSTQKSTLYRRRVVDLQSSLTLHYQNQQKLKSENHKLSEQIKNLQQKCRDLEIDYERLMQQSQKSNKNLRLLQKQNMQLNKKLQEQDTKKLKSQFQSINEQRNSIMAQKVALLKNYSKLESQNIQLKIKMANFNEKQKQQKYLPYNAEELNKIVSEISKMNAAHESIFNTLKSNSKLSKALIEKQNSYQNSLNKILEMLGSMQKNQSLDGNYFRFDHQQSFKQQINKIEANLIKKHKKQTMKFAAEKQELVGKLKSKDKKIQQIQSQNKQLQMKLIQVRKQKTQFMDQIAQLNSQIAALKQNKQKKDRQKIDQQILKQKSKDQEYRSIITELNEQMLTIQKQKKNLDGMISKMTNTRSEEDQKNRKKLNEIAETNQQIRAENQKVKEKYEAILIQKQHLYLSVTEIQNKNENLNREIARQVLQKEKLLSQLNRIKQQKQLNLVQLQRFKILSQNIKKQSQNSNNSYLFQIQRLIQQGMLLRQQIQALIRDRNELRELKSKYELLMKDNQVLGKKAKYTNSQIDHLWMIKQVQYQNLNKVINDLKPL